MRNAMELELIGSLEDANEKRLLCLQRFIDLVLALSRRTRDADRLREQIRNRLQRSRQLLR
eukprot:537926-Amphidinium_carterae.1